MEENPFWSTAAEPVVDLAFAVHRWLHKWPAVRPPCGNTVTSRGCAGSRLTSTTILFRGRSSTCATSSGTVNEKKSVL
jgi:hypothetical protein